MTPQNIRLAFFSSIVVVAVLVTVVVIYSYVLLPQSYSMGDESSARRRVIVVGGGLAGLSAAIEASRHGAEVIILDKEKNLGGNSAKATSGINGVDTPKQRAKGIEDSVRTFINDTMTSSDGLSDPELVNILALNSAAAIDWLDSFGLVLSDVVQLGGHSVKRTHRFPPTAEGKPVPVGFTIISRLRKYLETEMSDTVTAITEATFDHLTIVGGRVVGLHYVDKNGDNRSLTGVVIFASGGYANDHSRNSLLDEYVPQLASLPTTNGKWATGDVIKATRTDHLSLIHMNKVQVHPTGFIEPANPTLHTKFLAPEALRGCGAILIDAAGHRFVNELGRRDYVTSRIFAECRPLNGTAGMPVAATMLLTQTVIDRFGASTAGFYIYKKLIQEAGSLGATAAILGVDVAVLRETLALYRAAAAAGGRDVFGKTAFPVVFNDDDHFFIAYVTPSLHYCMGGLRINANTQVYRDSEGGGDAPGNILPGLYAAAEVTGGVHGNNRLGGNSLLECIVFGRIAGQHAAHYPEQSV